MTHQQGIVDLVRDAVEPGGRDRFSCSWTEWTLILELGRVFGWRARGATYVQGPGATAITPALRNYDPGDSHDYKSVGGEDAMELAAALERAKQSSHFATLIANHVGPVALSGEATPELQRSANASFETVLDEFIEYAYGGAFSFAMSTGDGTA
jgi:hypothetical protein